MHQQSGLLQDLHRHDGQLHYLAEVERDLLNVVPEKDEPDQKTVLAGSTVSFDLEFVRNTMPRLAARLSHRVYDVSAVKLFCRSLGMPALPKQEQHRAAADVLESIAHARACAEWLRPQNVLRSSERDPGTPTGTPVMQLPACSRCGSSFMPGAGETICWYCSRGRQF
jgi:oligoribonuclease (3'-5' exoribonuclease)